MTYVTEGGGYYPFLDHIECFQEGVKLHRPVAILSHSYQPDFEKHQGFAAEHCLHVEVLPTSWYFPGGALAVLYTRKPKPGSLG